METNKFESFFSTMIAAPSVKQEILIRDFLMSLSGDELWAWNQFMFKKSDMFNANLKASEITEEDKQFFSNWFDKFEDLEHTIKSKGRKAA